MCKLNLGFELLNGSALPQYAAMNYKKHIHCFPPLKEEMRDYFLTETS